ncbi:MAG TPA: hypothetical protein PK027_02705 [Aquimonas sp.]|nr:hypothetical protein [Aquimonas sp.]HRF53355.1 hypothetical protein [Aquimonas sp.]
MAAFQLPDNSGAPGGNQKTTYTYVGLTTNIKVEDTTDPSTALTMSRQVDALGRPVLTTDASAAQGKRRSGVRSSIYACVAVGSANG